MTKPKPTDEKKVDIEALRKRKPPLAKVLQALTEGKTARDTSISIAQDIALLMAAREPGHPLHEALNELDRAVTHEARVEAIRKQLTGEDSE